MAKKSKGFFLSKEQFFFVVLKSFSKLGYYIFLIGVFSTIWVYGLPLKEGKEGVGTSNRKLDLREEVKKIAGWGEVELGMRYEAVLKILEGRYGWIALRSDYIEGIPETENRFFVEAYPNSYFELLNFQFNEKNELYLIRIQYKASSFSFLELLTRLEGLYGVAEKISFSELSWQQGDKKVILERNRTLRYIDMKQLARETENRVPSNINKSRLETKRFLMEML